jgi:hypothetical protein
MRDRQLSRELCVECFRYAWLQSILEHVGLSDPIIGAFDPDEHSTVVAEFRAGDRDHIETTAARVRRLCAERATAARDEHRDAADLLQQQASRKRGHLPVRQLFAMLGDESARCQPAAAGEEVFRRRCVR